MSIEDGCSSRLIKNGRQYVSILHGATYSIKLSNGSSSRCDVSLTLDEVFLGRWRLESRDVLLVEGHPYSCSPFRMSTGGEILKATFYPERAPSGGGGSPKSSPGSETSLKIRLGEITRVPSLTGAQIDWTSVVEVELKLLVG